MKNKNFSIAIIAILFLIGGIILGKYLPTIPKEIKQEGLSIKSVVKQVGTRQPNGSILLNSAYLGGGTTSRYVWKCSDANGNVLNYLITQNYYPNGTGVNVGGANVACSYIGYID